MRMKQPKAYSLEFREQALRRVPEGSTPIRALAQKLVVHVETLRNWYPVSRSRNAVVRRINERLNYARNEVARRYLDGTLHRASAGQRGRATG